MRSLGVTLCHPPGKGPFGTLPVPEPVKPDTFLHGQLRLLDPILPACLHARGPILENFDHHGGFTVGPSPLSFLILF